MKKVNYVKLGLDLVLGVVFALFFNDRVLGGLSFHEIAGLIFGVDIIVHVFLNFKWVKNVTIKIFNRSLPGKTRLSYLLNLLLFILMITIIVTGIIVSKVVFPNLTLGNERWLQMLHLSVSYLTLVLVAIHIGLHWQWVINMSKKTFKISASPVWMDYAVKMAVVGLFLFGAYEIYATGFGTKLVSSATMFTGSEQGQFGQMSGKGFERGQLIGGEMPEDFNGERPTPPEGEFRDNGERTSGRSGGFQADSDIPSDQSDENSDYSRSNGVSPGNGELPDDFRGDMHGERGQSPNALGVLATYFGIMAVFVILTYYLGKIKPRRRETKVVV